jgi:hypothetical protein
MMFVVLTELKFASYFLHAYSSWIRIDVTSYCSHISDVTEKERNTLTQGQERSNERTLCVYDIQIM